MDRARAFTARPPRRPASAEDVQELIQQHPGEWLAIDVETETGGRPKAGRLVCHARDRDTVWRKTKSRRRLYIVYAGPPLREGYATAFLTL
jgi:hypothetical protein